MHQRLVIVGGEVKATALLVLKVFEQQVGELHCEFKVFAVPTRLQLFQQRLEQKRVVIQVRRGSAPCRLCNWRAAGRLGKRVGGSP